MKARKGMTYKALIHEDDGVTEVAYIVADHLDEVQCLKRAIVMAAAPELHDAIVLILAAIKTYPANSIPEIAHAAQFGQMALKKAVGE